jgi:hypothetical protein
VSENPENRLISTPRSTLRPMPPAWRLYIKSVGHRVERSSGSLDQTIIGRERFDGKDYAVAPGRGGRLPGARGRRGGRHLRSDTGQGMTPTDKEGW